jgi:hypothetical protein
MKRSWCIAAVTAVALVGACSPSEDTPEKVGEGGTSSTAGSQSFGVGERVALGDYEVVVHAVQNPMPPANQFLKPPAGKRWVALDTEVVNRTDKPKPFSALLAFELQDQANRTYDMTVTTGAQPGAPDGEIVPKGSKRGLLVFELPDDASSLRLMFKSNVFGTGQATIRVT